jgi:hypothetical protein
MLRTDMQRIVTNVCRRARLQGFILPEQVREELAAAGRPESWWQEVVTLAGDMLSNHDGCYYYTATGASSRREQQRQRRLKRAVRQLLRGYQSVARRERRGQDRMKSVHTALVETEDGHTLTLLGCDVSLSGVRLIGPKSLLGQKLRVTLRTEDGGEARCFSVQVVWSTVVAEGLCENGGAFLGVARPVSTTKSPVPTITHPYSRAELSN